MRNIHQIREISTLSFNERVLQEAEDPRNPLMERLKFLGIFSSNMDEFFKVRVASIQRRQEIGKKSMGKLLEAIAEESQDLDARFRAAYTEITEALEKENIQIIDETQVDSLDELARDWLREYFRETILPVLVPIILSRERRFPQLHDGALYLGVRMNKPKTRYAILEVPAEQPRFVRLPNGNIMYVDDVIRYFLDEVFYIFEYEKIEAFAFKLSRDAELDIDNDFSEGYIEKMERVLRQRRGGQPTRLVYDADMPKGLLDVLRLELQIDDQDTVIAGGRYHNMKDLMSFPSARSELSFPKLVPSEHYVFDYTDDAMIDTILEGDVLITYPYQSFDHLVRLLREAAIDPDVQTIKMTMYRSARQSQIVNALANAARNGKRIFVTIELQARFDEENNISISEKLSDAGAEVSFGVPPMKVHAKLLLIERGHERIAGLSTGNFNEKTGRLYVDSLLLTADARITNDVSEVFNLLARAARMRLLPQPKFKHLLVSPYNSRDGFMKYIKGQAALGKDGYVFIKTNHLTDEGIIKAILNAADKGVQMDLVVRTTYAIRPHPNIRAISILDRFLEHQRVYIFGRGDDAKVFMSSADLMERNLDWRVEAAFPIYDPVLKRQVQDMMDIQVRDTYKARILDETQSNVYASDGPLLRTQESTYLYLKSLNKSNGQLGKHKRSMKTAKV